MEKIGSSCAATPTGASSVGSAGVVGGELSGAGGQLDGKLELHVDGSLLVGEDAAGAEAAGAGMEDDVLVTEPVLGIRMLMSSRVRCFLCVASYTCVRVCIMSCIIAIMCCRLN
jgi:hypothetical protein